MTADTIARFSASVRDADGVKGNALSHLFIDGAQTVTQVKAALAAWESALDAISGGKIASVSATISPATAGTDKGAAVAGSEVQEVGMFDFGQAGLPYVYGEGVPAFLETLVTAGGQINEADPGVAAWVALLTGAVLGGSYTGYSTAGLTALVRTFRATRKHRRSLYSRSVRTP